MPDARPSAAPDMATLQRWLTRLIAHPDDAAAAAAEPQAAALVDPVAAADGAVIRPNERQTPLQRVDVYNGGYLTRLVNVLASDFGPLRTSLGDDAWRELAFAYVWAHPSDHPNLNQFGRHLPAFVAERHGDSSLEAALARALWAIQESFDAAEFEAFDFSTLGALSEADWAGLRLEPNPSVRLLALGYPVNDYIRACNADEEVTRPDAADSWLLLNRRDDRVWRTELPREAHDVLAALAAGATFGDALTHAGELDVGTWFQQWAGNGVFADAQRS